MAGSTPDDVQNFASVRKLSRSLDRINPLTGDDIFGPATGGLRGRHAPVITNHLHSSSRIIGEDSSRESFPPPFAGLGSWVQYLVQYGRGTG